VKLHPCSSRAGARDDGGRAHAAGDDRPRGAAAQELAAPTTKRNSIRAPAPDRRGYNSSTMPKAAAPSFAGFSRKMPSFFRGLERNNTREWFTPRKAVFEAEVRGPMIELVARINEDFKSFAVDYVQAVPAKALYRIYRDTRFSNDKTPYKTHVGAMFHRQGLPKNTCAGFYVGISHRQVEIAGGMYMPGPEELAAVREAIARRPAEFLKLANDRRLTKVMGPMLGAKLARTPKGFEAHADSPAADCLRCKQIYWDAELPAEVALSPRLRKEVVDRFKRMADVVEWINQAILARRTPDEPERPIRPEPMW
jgi:uncharacterized protein (TIGR02453 family)